MTDPNALLREARDAIMALHDLDVDCSLQDERAAWDRLKTLVANADAHLAAPTPPDTVEGAVQAITDALRPFKLADCEQALRDASAGLHNLIRGRPVVRAAPTPAARNAADPTVCKVCGHDSVIYSCEHCGETWAIPEPTPAAEVERTVMQNIVRACEQVEFYARINHGTKCRDYGEVVAPALAAYRAAMGRKAPEAP